MLDCHIHIMKQDTDKQQLLDRMSASGISGGVILSLPPYTFNQNAFTNHFRLENLLKLTEGCQTLYPFYFIDPLEKYAVDQVDEASAQGVCGFKIMSIDDYPKNPDAMKVYKRIAYHNKPILFHSGILWNNKDSSSFNRPSNFECLIEVEGLRFALAHVSWPWHDECLAVFGKYIASNKAGRSNTMYIDLTPGTPEIYREEVLTKLFTIGYDVRDYVLWGTDNFTEDYNSEWAKNWLSIDRELFRKLKLDQDQIAKIEGQNLLKFIKGASA